MFNFNLGGFGATVDEVVENIAKFGINKGVLPDTAEKISMAQKRIFKSYQEELKELLQDSFKNGGDDIGAYFEGKFGKSKLAKNQQMNKLFANYGDTIESSIKAGQAKEHFIETSLGLIDKDSITDLEAASILRKKFGDKVSNYSDFDLTMLDKYSYAHDYFSNREYASTRKKFAAGVGAAYLGTAAVNRVAFGGTLTRNNRGERDIAGIPFI